MSTMRNLFYVTFFISSSVFVSCGSKDRQKAETQDTHEFSVYKDDFIVGRWNVLWEMTGEEVAEYPADKRKMFGKMSFTKNGEVEVTTFGYEGCLFMPDTSTNVMNWKLENQVLRFMDKKDIHGIPYNIDSITQKEIRLSIMENIHLTLSR